MGDHLRGSGPASRRQSGLTVWMDGWRDRWMGGEWWVSKGKDVRVDIESVGLGEGKTEGRWWRGEWGMAGSVDTWLKHEWDGVCLWDAGRVAVAADR